MDPLKVLGHIGVDPTPELYEWRWDNNLAAVGGDMLAFGEIAPHGRDEMCCPSPPRKVVF